MAAKIYYQEDCNLSLLEGQKIAIIGYGSQGHAHALNLKESGCDVIIGLYEGSRSWKRAEEQGFKVYTAAEAAKQADIIMILINDEKQAKLYKEDIEPNLEEGNMLMFAHGFNIHFGTIVPPKNVDVTMIAPKAPGHTVRSEYQAGKGTPCLVAVEQDYTGKARIKILKGHFATKNSHVNTYIDMSTVKTRHNNARETAKTLAEEYMTNTPVETIVCLKNTEVIGAFMAEYLSGSGNASVSAGNNISVVTPEFDPAGQILFRDNNQRMIEGKQVLVLTDSMSTGSLVRQAIESVLYYGGRVSGICAVFSSISKVAGMEVKTIFTSADLPDYQVYNSHECELCKEGQKLTGLINSFGFVEL